MGSYHYVNFASVTAIGIIFPVLGLIALGIRIYGRVKYTRSLDIDDVLIIPAAILMVAAGVGMVIAAQMGFVGGHAPYRTFEELMFGKPERQLMLEKLEYAYWIGHVLVIGFTKLTFLFFSRRIFRGRGARTKFDYVNWLMIGVVTVWMVAYVFLEIFMCGLNFWAAWDTVYALRTYCMDTFALLTSCAITNWVIDLAIFAIPLVMINSLQMTAKRKVQASLVFALGLFTVIAGLLRMIIVCQVVENGLMSPTITLLGTTFETTDNEGTISLILFWTYVEIGVGFLVVCLVACGRVFDEASAPVLRKLKSMVSAATSVASRASSRSSLFSENSKEEKDDHRISVSTKVEVVSKDEEKGMPAVPEWLQASRRGTLDLD
ncbi:hypothetical protein CKM354_001174200 [Cercospora kikuchii]|uniref:Rhodopsin domain-containing protein n=1 Tax=Cercospora kikuchii TaxID=84275 RepID=A0A9P3FKH1_9PEZI|nr:uncharacterized protein CKM354_001174200 [Cercospora kikuchii]GIZ48692.1 hypothetical protein CKM354_001174200 [Cercospora kikuchii]